MTDQLTPERTTEVTPSAPTGPGLAVAVGTTVAFTALVLTMVIGGSAPQPPAVGLPDPGPLVGWLLPSLTLVADLAAIVVIGFLVLAAVLLPSSGHDAQGLAVDGVRIARRGAWIWFGSTVLLYVVTSADLFAVPLTQLDSDVLVAVTRDSEVGRSLVLQALGALVLALVLRWTIGIRALAGWSVFALLVLLPAALSGHAASGGSHSLATVSLYFHVTAVAVWVGGLVALGWVARRGSRRIEPAIARYSTVAAWCFAVVGVSGVLNASVRASSIDQLFGSEYGRMVTVKAVAFLALGVFGWYQRRRIVAVGGGFARLAASEILLMVGTIGVAVALSRTAPPVGDVLLTPAEDLIGGPMPPAPTVERFLTSIYPSGVGIAVVGLGSALYIAGVLVLRRRGDRWPVGRSIAWALGMVVVAWATMGGLGTYSHVLFSAHMVSHMLLSMVAPIFLVLGAPVTLALRALPGPRQPGEVSPRGMLTAALHSRVARFLTHPVVGPALFIGSLYALYFTPLFDTLMRSILGHVGMELHFLAVGTLFYYVIIGVDPSPRRLVPLARFGVMLVTLPFHAFFSIAVMSATVPTGESFYRDLDRPYLTDLVHDQYLGGSISWALGEVPLLIVMIALLVQWFRTDLREQRRIDRAADRDDDAELKAYNERLRRIAERDRR
ncbi:MAG: bifunctional copper resistance protein CopD/cytochrome c oxidase assembly protein [Aeromicrobium sp.]|uniref:bifunctional copper resistance protein CopD/cytochrome c oxidase assembly protein n=1 Tax=Aeromicrobium sp. TaxID=1871063 RepID=UPI0026051D23|nr:bifunctional copper resistance protein CopD/cytochrome c oxidase assembly protein [Aeromicrobium sp.]MDF1703177.1 bifunctional copper resistance protein CopD/cytochrome c oxidase assembly protein [Aeromicrobium sp.]